MFATELIFADGKDGLSSSTMTIGDGWMIDLGSKAASVWLLASFACITGGVDSVVTVLWLVGAKFGGTITFTASVSKLFEAPSQFDTGAVGGVVWLRRPRGTYTARSGLRWRCLNEQKYNINWRYFKQSRTLSNTFDCLSDSLLAIYLLHRLMSCLLHCYHSKLNSDKRLDEMLSKWNKPLKD